MPWALAQTHAGIEYRVEERLTGAGLLVYVARFRRSIKPRHTKKRRIVAYPLFPRLLFIETAPEAIADLRARIRITTGQCHLMRKRDQIALLVPDKDVDELKYREQAGEFDSIIASGKTVTFKLGDHVVVSGNSPFGGQKGIVEARLNGSRYRVGLTSLSTTIDGEHLYAGDKPIEPP
jgi:transcription antitermination factor NusG